MKRDVTVDEAIFQHLLNHFWKAVDDEYPKELSQAPAGYLISYKQLIEVSGVPLDPRNAGGPLFKVAAFCKENKLPPLHSLAVNKDSGMPGDGYFRAPGTDPASRSFENAFASWQDDVKRCIEFGPSKFARNAPDPS